MKRGMRPPLPRGSDSAMPETRWRVLDLVILAGVDGEVGQLLAVHVEAASRNSQS